MKRSARSLIGAGVGVVALGLACSGSTDTGAPEVVFVSPDPLFVGSWAYVTVGVPDGAGYALADLTFTVDEGIAAGQVSRSRDARFDPSAPTVMLMAGDQPGEDYTLRAWLDDVEVGSTQFDVTLHWDQDAAGQSAPIWIEGSTGALSQYAALWGSDSAAPQNVATIPLDPAQSPRRIAVVMLEFEDFTFADPAGEGARWVGRLETDVESVSRFYEEMTGGLLTITADAFGPYKLADADWDHVHDDRDIPEDAFFQACATLSKDDVDLSQYHSMLCVGASDLASPDTFTWPVASLGNDEVFIGDRCVNIGVVSMPEDWSGLTGREEVSALSHELGHNLRMNDQYTPSVPSEGLSQGVRNLRDWDLMHAEAEMPHVSLPHRLRLGLVDGEDLLTLNPRLDLDEDGQISQIVRLNPVGQLAPDDDDHYTGVEFRLADGQNYYFEYRSGSGAEMGDQGPTVPCCDGEGEVLMTEVFSDRGDAPYARPDILRATADGAVLRDVGDVWLQTDLGSGNALSVELTEIDVASNDAALWFRYGAYEADAWDGASPTWDPSIRPWPASSSQKWQSPDLSISNACTEIDPSLGNQPISDIPNTITASITNGGDVDALGVTVSFYAEDPNAGGGVTASEIGEVTRDVPAGETVDFVYDGWVPGQEGHYCVVAYIEPFDGEISADNNRARSNFDVIHSSSASPATREIYPVAVRNPYDQRTSFFLNVEQEGEHFRTYLEAEQIVLEPGETREITVMFEYILEDIAERERAEARVRLNGWLRDPSLDEDGDPVDAPVSTGGIDITLRNGAATEIGGLSLRSESGEVAASGQVSEVGSGAPVVEGAVVVVARHGDPGDPDYSSGRSELDASGGFEATLTLDDLIDARAYYLPGESVDPLAPSETDWTPLE